MTDMEMRLMEAISGLEIIDSHEHFGPESDRLKMPIDALFLFRDYSHWDLLSAGMSEETFQSLVDPNIPVETRWKRFSPYWDDIRFTSYSRAVLISLEKFFGITEVSDDTYERITDALRAASKPGIYQKVLREACNIRTCLTQSQCGTTDLGTDLLTPVMRLWRCNMESAEGLTHPEFEPGTTVETLDEYLDALGKYIIRVKSEGAVGVKILSLDYGEPDRGEALSLFAQINSGSAKLRSPEWPDYYKSNPLRDYVTDWAVEFAGKQDLTVAVHAGYWGDFRDNSSLNMIPMLTRHPEVRFDIYHLGFPSVRETLMLAKGFPNVWLNLCWTYIISHRCATEALDEIIDLIPTNKVLGFGGDYIEPVEKVYGHLVMARESIAEVLTRRIVRKQMSEDQALGIARKWLWDNPKQLYNLKLL